jgi:hypothetical protein
MAEPVSGQELPSSTNGSAKVPSPIPDMSLV